MGSPIEPLNSTQLNSIGFTRRGRCLTSFAEPVDPENSHSLRKIDLVKAVDGREFNNVAGSRCSYGATIPQCAHGEYVIFAPQTMIWIVLPLIAASPTLHGH
jgi:hypothetical protein